MTVDRLPCSAGPWAPSSWLLDVLETPRDGVRLWTLTLSDGRRATVRPLVLNAAACRAAWIALCAAAWELA